VDAGLRIMRASAKAFSTDRGHPRSERRAHRRIAETRVHGRADPVSLGTQGPRHKREPGHAPVMSRSDERRLWPVDGGHGGEAATEV
jgi:hypothetical protein